MSEILQRWLSNRLGIVFTIEPYFIGELASDGTLFARLLHSYDVINEDQMKFMKATSDPALRYENLQHLQVWLELIGVCCDDSVLREVAEGNGSTAIRLIYQMYLCFENKHKLRSANLQRKREEIKSRFQIERLSECRLNDAPVEETNILEAPLIANKHIIEWKMVKTKAFKDNWKNFKRKSDESNDKDISPQRFEEPVTENNTKVSSEPPVEEREAAFRDMSIVDAACDDEELSYDELKGLNKREREISCDCVNVKEAKYYVAKLNRQSRKQAATKSFQLQMQRLLMTELWSKLMAKQEREFDQRITIKLLKQSQYEKQMTSKMMQARLQKKAMAENRILVDKLLTEMREKQFSDALTRLRDEIQEEKEANTWEADKTKELHSRLYAEKQQLLYNKNYDMCMEVVEAIVDLSVKTANYISENDGNLPRKIWNEWKEIFFTSQPIFDVIPDVEYILEDEYSDEMEEIALVEFGRQEILNEHDFRDYLSLCGPWQVSDLFPEDIVVEPSQVVLGYIVHRLLDVKYPLPPPPTGAGLPALTAAAIVQGVHEPPVIDALCHLLEEPRILIITMDEAINFCLERFKSEMEVVRDIDLKLCRASEKAKEELEAMKEDKGKHPKKAAKKKKDEKNVKKELEKKKKSKKKGPKETSKATKEEHVEAIEPTVYEKETQTPRRIPDDDPLLSVTADLGRNAFDILCLGEQIPDKLLVQMLVEFLRDRASDIRGFVLIDFPINYEQAALLEEALTGRSLPPLQKPVEADLVEVIEEFEVREMESNDDDSVPSLEQLRTSRLVPNPIPPRPSEDFRTYFTAFIHAKKVTEGQDDDGDDPLEAVYNEQGMNYDFYYKTFDFPAVKQLARLIIGDMVLPPKASIELFGACLEGIEELLVKSTYKQVESQVKKKKGKTKASEPETTTQIVEEEPSPPVEILAEEANETGKKGKEKKAAKGKKENEKKEKSTKKGKAKKGKENAVEEVSESKHEEVNILDTEPPPIETVEPKIEPIAVPIPPPKPGEYGWIFVDLPQPVDIQCSLATLWENLEAIYIKDFQELFFEKRVILAKIMPYLNRSRRGMEAFISRPDDKQSHVLAFQLRFNAIDEELRPDAEMKNELHCRVAELRAFLLAACDLRRTQAESQRQAVVAEDWFPVILSEIVNVHVEAMQLEVDRCVDTLQLITDHCTSSLGRPLALNQLIKPPVARMALHPPESLTAIDTRPTVSSERRKSSSTFKLIKRLLEEIDSNRLSITPFHEFITDTVQALTSHVTRLKAELTAPVAKEEAYFADRCKKAGKEGMKKGGKEGKKGKDGKKDKGKKKEKDSSKGSKGKESKRGKSVGKKDKKNKGKVEESDGPVIPDEVGMKLCEEWKTALLDETDRVQLRLRMLGVQALRDVTSTLDAAQDKFHLLHAAITTRFELEVDAVNQLATTFCNAIEEEAPIQEELVLEQDRFYRSNVNLLFPDPLPMPPVPVEEYPSYSSFNVAQLLQLVPLLVRAAPTSVLPRAALAFILQDIATLDDAMWLPPQWYTLTHDEIAAVVCELSAGAVYADWKELVIRCLDVGYPTEEELVSLRRRYVAKDPRGEEMVAREDFDDVRLWFEQEFTDDEKEVLRKQLAKELLFEMFQVGDECNYSAMLLYFCKDAEPRRGLAKALALVLGVRVVTSEEEYQLHHHEDALRVSSSTLLRRAFEAAQEVIDDVVEEVIVTVAGIKIEEVYSASNVTNSVQESHTSTRSARVNSDTEMTPPPPPPPYPMPTTPPSLNEEVTTHLPFGAVLNLLTVCLPWWASSMVEESSSLGVRLEAMYELLAPEQEAVVAHQFFAHPFVDDLLKATNKFEICNLEEIVEKVIARRR